MALRMRNGITSQATSNQENVTGIGKAKTLATTGLPGRAALGEIGNVQTRQMTKTGKDAIPAKKNDVLKPITTIAIKKQTIASGTGLKNVTASTTTAKVITQKSTTQSLICKTSTLIKPSRAVIKPSTTAVTSATSSTAASIRPSIQIKPRARPVGTFLKTTSSSSLLPTGSLLIQKPFAPTHITVPKIPENSGIKDIDKESAGNPILLGEYAGEIYAFLKEMELKFLVEDDFLKGQQVNSKMRALVVDWLVDVQLQYSLLLETLHLAIGIFDRFLNKHRIIGRQELQLVGVTSMWIASKYEELFSPELENFVYITDRAYTKKKILEMEELIHKTLDFCYGQPLSIHFLRRYSNAAEADAKLHTYAKYFLELALITYSLRSVRPSLIAAVALYIGLCVVGNHGEPGRSIWSDCLQFYTTYSYDDIETYIPVLAQAILEAKSSKLQAVQRKYSGNKLHRVSSIVYLQSNVLEELARIESGKVKQ